MFIIDAAVLLISFVIIIILWFIAHSTDDNY